MIHSTHFIKTTMSVNRSLKIKNYNILPLRLYTSSFIKFKIHIENHLLVEHMCPRDKLNIFKIHYNSKWDDFIVW